MERTGDHFEVCSDLYTSDLYRAECERGDECYWQLTITSVFLFKKANIDGVGENSLSLSLHNFIIITCIEFTTFKKKSRFDFRYFQFESTNSSLE